VALASSEWARAIQERLARENPSVPAFRSDVAASYHNIGLVQRATGQPAEALASYERARAIQERLARENPSVPAFQEDLALSHNSFGLVQNEMGRPAEALASLEQARPIRERLAREHPELPDFASDLGATLNDLASIDLDRRQFDKARAGLTQAIKWQRKALAANPNHPTYRQFLANHLTNLIRASKGRGHDDEAAEAQLELAGLRNSDPRIVALDARLAAVLKGKETAKSDAERIQLAYRANDKTLHAASARLLAEALANNPELADDRQAQNRYNAACAASLAGSGKGTNDPPPNDAAKTKLRQQALEWLKAELVAWAKIVDSGPADMKAKLAPTLQHWKTDSDLAVIRYEQELAKLPEEERAAFKQLWNDVDQLLAKASGSR